jgi:predicted regulator of Ras-like GTPase activity (Roadblock/LC7/MglB family)
MFKNSFDKFVTETPGFWGGVIIGIDGIPVEQKYLSDRINLENTATEYITLLKKSNQINEQENLGQVKEAIFINQNIVILLHHINAEYYFLSAFDPKANLGMIRFNVIQLINDILREFS